MQPASAHSGKISAVGCVVIGRNEGERLRRCLESLVDSASHVVYVDSGSTDGSVELARTLGAEVVNLDQSRPFTAARARNAGYRALARSLSDARYVQFVDGDCVVADAWLVTAVNYLNDSPRTAVVCGRRRELHPDASVYNDLCDIEWDTPIGEARACGGDALVRCAAFDQVEGYDPALVAGEEPELCVRLRQKGWSIMRLAAEMTLHDAAMHRFGQWWKRTVRAGYAYAEGAHLHGKSDGHFVAEHRRCLFWGAGLPVAILATLVPTHGLSTLGAFCYAVSAWRCYRSTRERHDRRRSARYSVFCTVGKFAEFQGAARYHRGRLVGKPSTLIEYKGTAPKAR